MSGSSEASERLARGDAPLSWLEARVLVPCSRIVLVSPRPGGAAQTAVCACTWNGRGHTGQALELPSKTQTLPKAREPAGRTGATGRSSSVPHHLRPGLLGTLLLSP